MMQKNTLIPIHRPKLPTADEILPYLQRIDAARWYSNFGPLLREFEERTADHFGLSSQNITSATNGTLILTAILRALDIPEHSLCIMPSWTFIATAAAAYYAGLTPYFMDVDKTTQALDPEKLQMHLKEIKQPIGAVIVVAPFGAPIDRAAWNKFMEETGIPVIIDAAACFDAVGHIMRVDNIPTMISLHATKVFGMGEGGIVLSKDELLINKIKSFISFGFKAGRESLSLGLNAKLSEYSAAVGLASLDNWHKTQSAWQKVRDFYIQALNQIQIKHSLDASWISGTCNVTLPGQAKEMGAKLISQGVDTRQWWLDGCHRHKAYTHFPRGDHLEVTQWLSASVLGLPFSIDLSNTEITYICNTLHALIHSTTKIISVA